MVGDKNHRWRNSIDVFDSGIWATIDQLLTESPFPPFFSQPFKALVIIARTQRGTIQGILTTKKDVFSTKTQTSIANTNIDYQATAQILCISTRVYEEEK